VQVLIEKRVQSKCHDCHSKDIADVFSKISKIVPIVLNIVWSKCFGTNHNDSRANAVPTLLVKTASKEETLGHKIQVLEPKASATAATTDDLGW
jgi:hypothetical protein